MFEPHKWTILAAAIVGAAGTLTGLFVVAISVRLDIATTRRAAATRGAHPAPSHHAVCRGGLVLIPDQPSRLLGLEFILTAGTFGVALLLLDRRALTQHASTDHPVSVVCSRPGCFL